MTDKKQKKTGNGETTENLTPSEPAARLTLDDVKAILDDTTAYKTATLHKVKRSLCEEIEKLHQEAAVLRRYLNQVRTLIAKGAIEDIQGQLRRAYEEQVGLLAGRSLVTEDGEHAKARDFLKQAQAAGVDLDLVKALADKHEGRGASTPKTNEKQSEAKA
jgi:DNA-binding transcriptional MerR regulator